MITYEPVSTGISRAFRDTAIYLGGFHILAYNSEDFRTAVDARFYRSASYRTVYAAIWVRTGNNTLSGAGTARGYNYDRRSAALWYALQETGIRFQSDAAPNTFDSCGEEAAIRYLTELTKELYPNHTIQTIRSHA